MKIKNDKKASMSLKQAVISCTVRPGHISQQERKREFVIAQRTNPKEIKHHLKSKMFQVHQRENIEAEILEPPSRM